jgi:hypothetical protein
MEDPLGGVAVQYKCKHPHFEEEFFKSNRIFVLRVLFLIHEMQFLFLGMCD